jgi:hypothetical protein
MSLALLVVGVIDHGSLCIDCSGATPNASGLLRLGRDLMRRSGSDNMVAGSMRVAQPSERAGAQAGDEFPHSPPMPSTTF